MKPLSFKRHRFPGTLSATRCGSTSASARASRTSRNCSRRAGARSATKPFASGRDGLLDRLPTHVPVAGHRRGGRGVGPRRPAPTGHRGGSEAAETPPAKPAGRLRENNRAENSHLPTNRLERQQQLFKSQASAPCFLTTQVAIHNTFQVQRHLISRPTLRRFRARADAARRGF
jgi:hypothetical protein